MPVSWLKVGSYQSDNNRIAWARASHAPPSFVTPHRNASELRVVLIRLAYDYDFISWYLPLHRDENATGAFPNFQEILSKLMHRMEQELCEPLETKLAITGKTLLEHAAPPLLVQSRF